jgi:predicted PurR-regulated permease PerM
MNKKKMRVDMDKKMFKSLLGLITFTAVLVAVVVKIDTVWIGVSKGMSVVQPLILGATIAFVLNKPYMKLQNVFKKITGKSFLKNHSSHLGLTLTYVAFVGFIVGIVGFVIPQVSESVQLLYGNLGNYIGNLNRLVASVSDYLKIQHLDLSNFESSLSELPSIISKGITGMMPGIFNFTSNLVSSVVNIILGFILSIYMLADKVRIKRQFLNVTEVYMSKKRRGSMLKVLRISHATFSSFVAGQLTEALILGTLCFIGMMIFGFEYALLISVLMGITSIIPVVGPLVGLIPSLFILVISSPTQALWFLVFILILQQFEGSFIYPRVVGGQIGLPGLWVLSTITIGGGLFGILGMLIGIPLVSIVYKLVKQDVVNRKGTVA